MADKTIGELPAASEVYDDSLLVMEQQGQARSVTGALIKKYARDVAAPYVEDAKKSAEAAEESKNAAAGSAEAAAESLAKLDDQVALAQAAREGAEKGAADAEKARQAIEDMTVEASSIPAGSEATVTKTTGPSGAVNLAFGIPPGETGPVGPAGPPGGVDSVDGMQGNIKTRLSFEVSLPANAWTDGAQTVKDARFLSGDYDYIVDLAGQLSGADDVTEAGQMTFHADLVPTAAVTVKIVRLGVYIDG